MALTIDLTLNSQKFQKGLKDSVRATKETQQKLNNLSGSLAIKAGVATAAFTGLGVGVKKLIGTYQVQEQAEKKLAQALKTSGTAANVSLEELKKYASELQNITTFGDEATISAQAMLLNLGGSLSKKVIKDATVAMQNMSAVMGTDLKNSAQQLGVALADPLLGMTRLRRVGILFTNEEREKIKALQDSGKASEAQSIIIDKVNRKLGGQAELLKEGTGILDQVSNAVGDLNEAFGKHLFKSIASSAKEFRKFIKNMTEDEDLIKKVSGHITDVGIVLGTIGGSLLAASIGMKALSASLAVYNIVAGIGAGLTTVLTGGFNLIPAAALAAKAAIGALIGAGGIKLVSAYLPEAIDLIKKFYNWLKKLGGFKPEKPPGLAELRMQEEKIKAQQEMEKLAEEERKQFEAEKAARKKQDRRFQETEEFEQKKEHFERLLELDQNNDAIRKEWEAEQKQFEKEGKVLDNEELLEIARRGITSEDKVVRDGAERALKTLEKRRRDEDKLNQRRLMGTQMFLSSYSSLQSSNDKNLKRLGKASAIANILINSAKDAFTIFGAVNAAFPFLAPVVGAAAAAPVIHQGKESIAQVHRAQTGGIVPRAFGTPQSGDNQLMLLEPGELITPRDDVELNRQASKLIVDALNNREEQRTETDVNVSFTGDYSDILEAETIEHRSLGIGVVR